MGWKETSVTEQTGKDGGPIETKDVSALDVIRSRIASTSARSEGSIFRAFGGFSRLMQRCSEWIAVMAKSVGSDIPPRL